MSYLICTVLFVQVAVAKGGSGNSADQDSAATFSFSFGGGSVLSASERRHFAFETSFGVRSARGFRSDLFFGVMASGSQSAQGVSLTKSLTDLIYGVRFGLPLSHRTRIGLMGGGVNRRSVPFASSSKTASPNSVSGNAIALGGEFVYKFTDQLGLRLQLWNFGQIVDDVVVDGQNVSLNLENEKLFNALLTVDTDWFGRGTGGNWLSGCCDGINSGEALLFILTLVFVLSAVFIGAKALIEALPEWDEWWTRWQVGSSAIYNESRDSSGNIDSIQRGLMHAVRFSAGKSEQLIGFAAEVGRLDTEFVRSSLGIRSETKGAYAMIGPRIHSEQGRYYFETLAGTTDQGTLPLIGIARLGVQIPLFQRLELGLNVGGLYLEPSNGALFSFNDPTRFNFVGGVDLGLKY